MHRKHIIITFILAMIFTMPTASLMAQEDSVPTEKQQQKKDSPFLITGKLPHLTKMLIQQWDNPELNLSEEQKKKLLVVRKETISSVQKLGRKIAPLEKQVKKEIFAGKTANELHSIVEAIAQLKTEATMVHLRCIHDTNKILDSKQQDLLKTTAK